MNRSFARLVAPIASGLSNPAALFGGATVAVFLTALSASWWATSNARAQTVGGTCMAASGNSCVSLGANPCPTACTSDGLSGYTCIDGGGFIVPEGSWQLQPLSATSWPFCQTTTNSAPTCKGIWQSCGTTQHYPKTDINCAITCAGNWFWLGCQGFGTPCP